MCLHDLGFAVLPEEPKSAEDQMLEPEDLVLLCAIHG